MSMPKKGGARSSWFSPKSSPRGPSAPRPPVPHYKIIPGTSFLVDGFTHKDKSRFQTYFLSHFHSDHYMGISKGFHHGKIYCSNVTGNLVHTKLGVKDEFIVRLGLNRWYDVDEHKVVLLEANHCPGAVLFLFLINNLHYLHTGDFRYTPKMKDYPALHNIDIEGLFLDTTFLNPKYNFPPQEITLQAAAEIALKEDRPGTLIIIGTYQIGKEKVLLSVAKALGKKIYINPDKWKLLQWLDLDLDYFVRDPASTNIHVVPLGWLNFESMGSILEKHSSKYSRVVGISPTGWNNSPKPHERYVIRKQGFITVYGLPYSEHCSYSELREFVSWVNPKRVIPTVNCASNDAVQKMLKHFEEKPLKKPDYGTLFPLIKQMRVQAAKSQAEAEAREEMEEIDGDDEPPPVRLMVQDSQLLLLEAQGDEPEDSYVKITKQFRPESPILVSDDAADLPPSEPGSDTLATPLSIAATSYKFAPLTSVKGLSPELDVGLELVDLEALSHNASFIEEQRRVEALFANTPTTPMRSYSTPPYQQKEGDMKKEPPSQRKSRSFGEATSEKQPKRAKTLTPDPKQPTMFSFLTRSKSSNLQ